MPSALGCHQHRASMRCSTRSRILSGRCGSIAGGACVGQQDPGGAVQESERDLRRDSDSCGQSAKLSLPMLAAKLQPLTVAVRRHEERGSSRRIWRPADLQAILDQVNRMIRDQEKSRAGESWMS